MNCLPAMLRSLLLSATMAATSPAGCDQTLNGGPGGVELPRAPSSGGGADGDGGADNGIPDAQKGDRDVEGAGLAVGKQRNDEKTSHPNGRLKRAKRDQDPGGSSASPGR